MKILRIIDNAGTDSETISFVNMDNVTRVFVGENYIQIDTKQTSYFPIRKRERFAIEFYNFILSDQRIFAV